MLDVYSNLKVIYYIYSLVIHTLPVSSYTVAKFSISGASLVSLRTKSKFRFLREEPEFLENTKKSAWIFLNEHVTSPVCNLQSVRLATSQRPGEGCKHKYKSCV